jgi:hypothetical protein
MVFVDKIVVRTRKELDRVGHRWRGECNALESTLERGNFISAMSSSPSFVITLSWHTSVKKVALSTPKFLTSAQQSP